MLSRSRKRGGKVIWLSGLSGAGKSTICDAVAAKLRERAIPVQVLDGDALRQDLCPDLQFSLADRFENVRRTAYLSEMFASHGVTVLVALITPLCSMRELVRRKITDVVEVFVDASVQVCESRDPKGLYRSARNGNLCEFTGVSSPFEAPETPDIRCNTEIETVDESSDKILKFICGTQAEQQSGRQRTIAVDFDGVIADYHGWVGPDSYGEVRPDVRSALHVLRNEGWKIVVHSTRGCRSVSQYLDLNDIPYDEINVNSDYVTGGSKPVATVYWDDRALCYSGNAHEDLAMIRAFRTWNNRL